MWGFRLSTKTISCEAIIDTDVFVANAKKFGTYCATNPNISVVNAAEKILGQ